MDHRDFIGYKFVKVKGKPTPLDSCIGGVPYLPRGKKMPKTEVLYVQINFDKEKIELPGFPRKGILQFFIPEDDGIWEGKGTARYYEKISDDYQKDIVFMSNKRVYAPVKITLKKVINKYYGIGISGIGGAAQTCQSRTFGEETEWETGTDLWFGMDTDMFGLEMLGDCGIIVCYEKNGQITNGTKLKMLKEKGQIKVNYYGDCY